LLEIEIIVTIAFCPPVFVPPLLLVTVTVFAGVIVTTPAPFWTIIQLKPAAKPAGTVSVIADAFSNVTTLPLSEANKVYVVPIWLFKFAFIGAGAVVTKTVPPYALLVGNPAKQIGWMSEFGSRLNFNKEGFAFCEESNEKYQLF
jgi:hypothetical protein